MSTRSQREHLKVQLLETKRLKELAGDHPLMSVAFAEREQELQEKVNALPIGAKEARTVLFFSGAPVQGSMGIDAGFAGRVLDPFQNMVKADYADRWHGVLGSRGRRFGETESRLLLTGLPRGSFGLELTRAESDQLFEEGQLADTLTHIIRLVEAAAKSDEDFAAQLDDTAPRVVQNLRIFLEVVAKGKAGLRLESGDFRCEMNQLQAMEAFNRVADTISNEEDVEVAGVLKGVLLESWRYDFVTLDGHTMGGKIDQSLSDEQVIALSKTFFNEQCVALLLKTSVLFKNGRVRTTYTLKDLKTLPTTQVDPA